MICCLFFFFFYGLFIFAALGLHHCTRGAGLLSRGGCVAFSLRWLLLLRSTGSVVVTHRLSCPMACIKPLSPALAGGFLSTGSPAKPMGLFFLGVFWSLFGIC